MYFFELGLEAHVALVGGYALFVILAPYLIIRVVDWYKKAFNETTEAGAAKADAKAGRARLAAAIKEENAALERLEDARSALADLEEANPETPDNDGLVGGAIYAAKVALEHQRKHVDKLWREWKDAQRKRAAAETAAVTAKIEAEGDSTDPLSRMIALTGPQSAVLLAGLGGFGLIAAILAALIGGATQAAFYQLTDMPFVSAHQVIMEATAEDENYPSLSDVCKDSRALEVNDERIRARDVLSSAAALKHPEISKPSLGYVRICRGILAWSLVGLALAVRASPGKGDPTLANAAILVGALSPLLLPAFLAVSGIEMPGGFVLLFMTASIVGAMLFAGYNVWHYVHRREWVARLAAFYTVMALLGGVGWIGSERNYHHGLLEMALANCLNDVELDERKAVGK